MKSIKGSKIITYFIISFQSILNIPWVNSLWIGFLSWSLSIFLYSPRLTLFLGYGSGTTRRDDLLAQCFNPLTTDLKEPILAYRIIQPILANLMNVCGERREAISLLGSPGIAYFALIITLAGCHWAIRREFSSRISILITFLVSTTMVTQWTNLYWGHPDSISLMAIALLLCISRPWAISVLVAIGALNDERMILAFPFIVIWWWPPKSTWKKAIVNMKPQIIAMFFGVLIYILFRQSLELGLIGTGIENSYPVKEISGLSRIFKPNEWLGLILMAFLGFRWLWFLPIYSAGLILNKNMKISSYFYLFALLLTSIATFTVADVSRSFAFIFPAILVALKILKEEGGWKETEICYLLTLILTLNILTPAATVFGVPPKWWQTNPLNWVIPYFPLPINVWQWLRVPSGAASWSW